VCSQEVAPGLRVAPRRRWQAGAAQAVADGTRRDSDTELAELAGDPQVAPVRVLAREPDDQLADVPADRRSAWPAVRVGPAPSHQPAMPSQKRLRPHEEGVPRAARQHATERSQQQPVVRLLSCSVRLATSRTCGGYGAVYGAFAHARGLEGLRCPPVAGGAVQENRAELPLYRLMRRCNGR
jgi:hypothetical protein